MAARPSPTRTSADELQRAYDHFNKELFGGRLPRALLTYTRRRAVLGHFAPESWQARTGRTADEIAMNPEYFRKLPAEDVLSTLVHEMAHQEQAHFGRPSRPGYHNREWAALMRRVGLVPSDTGKPGGRQTGQRMTHYIEAGGLFESSVRSLLEAGFQLTWADASRQASPRPPEAPGAGEGSEGPEPQKPPRHPRAKSAYRCPDCGIRAWGKPDLRLGCLDCGGRPLEAA